MNEMKHKPVTAIASSIAARQHRSLDGEAIESMPQFMTVRQVAGYLHLNEKKVYALVNDGKIPATKVTGKWLFPRALVDQWILESSHGGVLTDRLLINGSDDPLIARAISSLAIVDQLHQHRYRAGPVVAVKAPRRCLRHTLGTGGGKPSPPPGPDPAVRATPRLGHRARISPRTGVDGFTGLPAGVTRSR